MFICNKEKQKAVRLSVYCKENISPSLDFYYQRLFYFLLEIYTQPYGNTNPILQTKVETTTFAFLMSSHF